MQEQYQGIETKESWEEIERLTEQDLNRSPMRGCLIPFLIILGLIVLLTSLKFIPF